MIEYKYIAGPDNMSSETACRDRGTKRLEKKHCDEMPSVD